MLLRTRCQVPNHDKATQQNRTPAYVQLTLPVDPSEVRLFVLHITIVSCVRLLHLDRQTRILAGRAIAFLADSRKAEGIPQQNRRGPVQYSEPVKVADGLEVVFESCDVGGGDLAEGKAARADVEAFHFEDGFHGGMEREAVHGANHQDGQCLLAAGFGDVASGEGGDQFLIDWCGHVVGAADCSLGSGGECSQQHFVAAPDDVETTIFEFDAFLKLK